MFDFLFYLLPLALSAIAFFKVRSQAQELNQHKQNLFKLRDRVYNLEQKNRAKTTTEVTGQTTEEATNKTPIQTKPGPQDTSDIKTTPPWSTINTPTIDPTKIAQTQATASKEAIKTSSQSLEKQVGAKWSVWVGGLALALGAIFLVRHSIVEGYLTPTVRIFLSLLFSGALLGAGEALRRKAFDIKIDTLPSANIPSIITAAGITGIFATCYAAYALYNMLAPLTAFILLGAVSIASLLCAALHGPMLATAGLVGAYATPALVASNQPAAWPLFIYLLFVTAAITITCHVRNWPWITFASLICASLWGLIWYGTAWSAQDSPAMATYILSLLAIAFVGLKKEEATPQSSASQTQVPTRSWDEMDLRLPGALAIISSLIFVLLRMDDYSILSTLILALTTGGLLYSAWRFPSLILAAPLSAILFVLAYLSWHIPSFNPLAALSLIPRDPLTTPIATPPLATFLAIGTGFAFTFAMTGFFALLKSRGNIIWALVSALAPLVIFIECYFRATHFEQSVPFALIALSLAGAATWATEFFYQNKKSESWDIVTAIYAITAIAALSLSLTIILDKGWLTNSIALTTLGIAWVSTKRNLPILPIIALILTCIVSARLLFEPRIMGNDLGAVPIFNWLLYGYGLPAACFGLAAKFFKKSGEKDAVPILQAASILFTTILIFLEIRHWLHDGNIYATQMNLLELSLHTATWLGLSIGLQKIFQGRLSSTISFAITALRIGSLVSILIGHLIIFNPVFTNASIGNHVLFNDLLLAYALPAILAGIIYYMTPNRKENIYALVAGATAFIMLFAYITLEVRALFHAPHLGSSALSNAESYCYSIAWLALAIGLLIAGTIFNSKTLRYISLPLLVLVVFKVFIYDTAHLSSLWRAFSFMGLGLALLGIGYLYQKVIIPKNDNVPSKLG